MKRNPRKVKWTKAYRKLAGKELAEVQFHGRRFLGERCMLSRQNIELITVSGAGYHFRNGTKAK